MANYYATITGQLRDPDGVPWKQAQWTAVPVSPSSKPVFPDGSPVPTMSGTLDDTGHFSGQVPQTLSIIPPGTTLTITISPLTSSAPVTLTKVQTGNNTTLDLGALLSPRIPAPRIAGSAIVYAYDVREITNPKHGNGYINTTSNRSFVYVQNSWQAIGTSIDPARVAYLDQANAFTQANTFGNGLIVPVSIANPSNPADASLYVVGGANYFVIDSPKTGAMLLNWDGGTGGVIFGNGAGGNVAHIDSAGNIACNGSVFGGSIWAYKGATPQAPPLPYYECSIRVNDANGDAYISAPTQTLLLNYDSGAGGVVFGNGAGTGVASVGSDGTGIFYGGVVAHGGAVPAAACVAMSYSYPGVASYLDTFSHDNTALPQVIFRVAHADGGGQVSPMAINSGGIWVSGTIGASGAKPFIIPYPQAGNEGKYLVHCCLEGPENGLYYRGEAETAGGVVTITLPEYFELIARPDGRSVQLTQIDVDGTADFSMLAASRVVDGAFTVWSSNPQARFAWQVNGVRADIPELAPVVEADSIAQAGERATRIPVNAEGSPGQN